jgi:hypothetical protein
VSSELDAKLLEAIKLLEKTCKPRIRGEKSFHIGYWRRYALMILLSRDSQFGANAFCELPGVREFFSIIDDLFEIVDRELFEEYCAVTPDKQRVCGKSFLMTVLNRGGSDPHIDSEDRPDGCCCVVPVGEGWTGGELAFRDLHLVVDAVPGDVVFFRSAELYHENLDHVGDRHSIVLTTDNNSFTASGQLLDPEMIEEARRYNDDNNVVEKDKIEWCLRPFSDSFKSAADLRAYIKERAIQRIQQHIAVKKNKHIIDATKPNWDSRPFQTKTRKLHIFIHICSFCLFACWVTFSHPDFR